MSAPEVVIEIVRQNVDIKEVLFKTYTPTKNLEEDREGQTISINQMLRHCPTPESDFYLKREEITLDNINKIIGALNKETVLGIASKVKLNSQESIVHIPLMDFKCEISSQNLDKIKEFLRKVDQEGVILETKRSYHFYGFKLITTEEWYRFLGRCLLFSDFTDSRYVGHRLIAGFSVLRISENITRYTVPKVSAIVDVKRY